jgi:hypothetical protein
VSVSDIKELEQYENQPIADREPNFDVLSSSKHSDHIINSAHLHVISENGSSSKEINYRGSGMVQKRPVILDENMASVKDDSEKAIRYRQAHERLLTPMTVSPSKL